VLPYVNMVPSRTSGVTVKLVHIGICNRHRGLSGIIDLMKMLDSRFTLDFILIPEDELYYSHLVNKSAADDRINFLSPVAQNQICITLNSYDIGVYPQSPKSFNYLNGLPNKFFEFIQARLGVAIWPIPEMKKIVKHYQNGIVSSRFSLEELAAQLNALTVEDINMMKRNSSRCAEENCAENEYLKMQQWLDKRLK
jgi:glycosyltransferase involved in cell wall biosynthesis